MEIIVQSVRLDMLYLHAHHVHLDTLETTVLPVTLDFMQVQMELATPVQQSVHIVTSALTHQFAQLVQLAIQEALVLHVQLVIIPL